MLHTITILHVPGCAGGRSAFDLASGIARARPDVSVNEVIIEGDAVALASGFRGSPTVLIDGRDIETDPQTPVGSMG